MTARPVGEVEGVERVAEEPTLRKQQAGFTKELVFEALRQVLEEDGTGDFSVQKVADRAGVSHRTIYRYFPTRQVLLDEFVAWVWEHVMGYETAPVPIRDLETLADDLRQLFAIFDAGAPYFEAGVLLSEAGRVEPAGRAERDARARELLDEVLAEFGPAQQRMAFAVIRHLAGLSTWFALRRRLGLDAGEGGEAVAWAVDELLAALRAGRAPRPPGETERNDTGGVP